MRPIVSEEPPQALALFHRPHGCADSHATCRALQAGLQTAIAQSKIGGGQDKLAAAIEHLNLTLVQSKLASRKIAHLARDARRQKASIETRDLANPRASRHTSQPELFPPIAIRGNNSQTRNHHPTRCSRMHR